MIKKMYMNPNAFDYSIRVTGICGHKINFTMASSHGHDAVRHAESTALRMKCPACRLKDLLKDSPA